MTDARELRVKATQLFNKGKFVKSAEAFAEYCALETKDHQSRLRCGDAWNKAGQQDKAIGCYVQAATGYAHDGFLPRAIAVSKLILELDPTHRSVQTLLAQLYAQKSTVVASPTVKRSPSEGKSEVPPESDVDEGVDVQMDTPAPLKPAEDHRVTFTELELSEDTIVQAVDAATSLADEPVPSSSIDLAALPRIPLFSDLPEDAFLTLFERCPVLRIGNGHCVFSQGDEATALYVVCAGSVQILRGDDSQRQTLATLEEGTFFGEMALLSHSPRSATAKAASDDTQLLEISATVLRELAGTYPSVAAALKRFCRQRLLSNIMSSSELFAPFSPSDRRHLIEKFKSREVSAGDRILVEGQGSDGLYVVLSGTVAVEVAGTRVAELREGQVFGEMSLLTRAPATATVLSVGRTSLLRLSKPDFDVLILTHPQVLEYVATLLEHRSERPEAEAILELGLV